jgi:hypothetical protein
MDSLEKKRERLIASLSFREPDRIPRFDLFWSEFVDKWRVEKKLPPDADIYDYYDMDLVSCVANIDPRIQSFELLERGPDYTVFRSGFGCILKKADYSPMPAYQSYSVESADDYESFVLEDPDDERRYYQESANILSSSGDRIMPSFSDQLKKCAARFPTMGLVLEGQELLWRIRGMEDLFIDLMTEETKLKRFLDRLEEFEIRVGLNQIRMGVDFMFIGGDVAYDKGLFFSPEVWRNYYKPFLRRMCLAFRKAKPDIKLIYHGCGRAVEIYDELIECGIDAYQSLEVKAGLDVVELRKQFGTRLAFVGNIDVRDCLTGDKENLRREVLRKLNAAKGGGYIPMSDHSVPDNVPVDNYDYYIRLINEFGRYPLDLGEFDIPVVSRLSKMDR